ncbi:MAG: multidrug ABC transporter ATP-binding protein [Planctomycetota bacterium]|nr:MAG: multidrug ABC transporter ATP-binding protein [Planctomycetota bacterium]
MIEVVDLRKRYGEFEALRGVSFTVERGEVVGFLGPNGAGKTTTMKILTGFLLPTSGTARIAGHDVVQDSLAVRRRLGYLPENAPLYEDMQPREFLDVVGAIHGLAPAVRRRRIAEVAERCGIADVLTVPIGHLSKGYRQRVGIAYTLLHEPDLLILDEPTSGLDPNQVQEIRQLLREIGREKTVMLSTHILREVEATCGRVLIINRGEIVADAPPADLQKGDVLVVAGEGAGLEQARAALAALPGVRAVEADGGAGSAQDSGFRLRLRTDGRDGLGAEVFRLARDRGWTLTELRPENASLEEVFQELTSVN